MKKRDTILAASSLLLGFFIVLIRPLSLSLRQATVLAAVMTAVIWWATNAVPKWTASLFLISAFFIFSSSTPMTILRFPLSSNMVLIVTSFLIAQGIRKSGLADRIARLVISRYAHSGGMLVILSFALSFLLVFLIPQTFPRAIILATIYREFLERNNIGGRQKSAILLSAFVAITATSMAFINGDIIFNTAAMNFAGLSLNWVEWANIMLVPTLAISLLMMAALIFVFRNDILPISISEISEQSHIVFGSSERKGIMATTLIVALWVSEPLHHINAAWTSVFGVLLLFALRLINLEDFKIIKLDFLLFLTAAFAIGGVLNQEGIARIIFSQLMPSGKADTLFIFNSIVVVMILHMILGSSMTTMSLCIPILMSLKPSEINPVIMMFIIYTAINIHYLLPIHHAVIMVGEGERYYDSRMTMRYGLFLTFFVFISIFLILIPYSKLIGQ